MHNLTPLARVVGYSSAGVDPTIMGHGPVPAINNALKVLTILHSNPETPNPEPRHISLDVPWRDLSLDKERDPRERDFQEREAT